jgi:hypothetical protein
LDKFLTPAKDGRDRPVSRPGRFTPGERAPGTQWIGVWARLKTGLDAADDNLLSLSGNETRFLGHPARSLVTTLRYHDDVQLLFVGRAVRVRSGWDAAKLQGGCDVILDNE